MCYTSFPQFRTLDMSPQATLPPQFERPVRIPQPTDAYRKAHKLYVLASFLLAAWELIGIKFDTNGKWGFEFKSPIGVPMTLVTFVLYYGYKMGIIEWKLQSDAVKNNKWIKIDNWFAHSICFGAILISPVQHLAKIQIADFLGNIYAEQVLFLSTTALVCISVGGAIAWKKLGLLRRIVTVLSALLTFSYLLPALVAPDPGHCRYGMASAAIGLGVFLALLSVWLPSRTQAASD